jgi:hypothetical protein
LFERKKSKEGQETMSSAASSSGGVGGGGGGGGGGAKPKIKVRRPYSHQVQVDPQYAAKTWKLLKSSIEHIHKKNASGLSFEELYRYF